MVAFVHHQGLELPEVEADLLSELYQRNLDADMARHAEESNLKKMEKATP